MKVLLCCIGKEENQYIREYVEYYKNLGFDNICLYDNNDIDGERFEDVIGDYIASGFVILKDYRGRKKCQLDAYNECFQTFRDTFDWIAYFDCDEFLTLVKRAEIHDYLEQKKFKLFDAIHINWKGYGDGNQLTNDGRPLLERITQPLDDDFKKTYDFPENYHIKTIVKTKNSKLRYTTKFWSHTPEGILNCCNAAGCGCKADTPFNKYDFKEAYIRHFSTKTITEFCHKLKRGFPDQVDVEKRWKELLKGFFTMNEKTPEKLAIVKQELGIDYGNKRDDVQIFMLCYSPQKYEPINNSIITPIQCGAAVSGYDFLELKDNQGADNVSDMNRFYVENSGTYWIWKNIHNAKYIGQMQYGRRLEISEDWDYDKIFSEYDAIVAKPYHFEKLDDPSQIQNGGTGWIPANTIAEGYAYSHCGRDLALLEAIIKKVFPDYAEDYDKYIKNGKDLLYSAGFVMKADLFRKYGVFLFSCLKSWLLSAGIQKPTDLYIHVMRNVYTGGYIRPEFKNPNLVPNGAIDWQTSLGGFFGERLLTLFIFHNCKNIKYVEYEKMNTDKPL